MSSASLLDALPDTLPAAVMRSDAGVVVAAGAVDTIAPDPGGSEDSELFAAIDGISAGWWAGFAGYDLGREVERVDTRTPADPTVPAATFVRFATRVALADDGTLTWYGTGAERRALERAVDSWQSSAPDRAIRPPALSPPWRSSLDQLEYQAGVRTIQELIRRGDCYQVNLTRQLRGPALDPVRLFSSTADGNPAPYTAFWRDGRGLAIVSASPERFLRVDGARVETRPIKGTATRASQLVASEKDRAENVMIVDLARNDLGRVCVPGSVTVPELCRVETHPGLVHLVSTVRGERRADVGLGGLLRATFPPASITGAPKPRVMQAIEDLEPVRRGVYCGALGWIDADRDRADLAVAIRTFTCTPEATTLGVGAGITIDSEPNAEWAETELKASRLLALAGERRDRALVSVHP